MDPLSLAVGAAILAAGHATGRLSKRPPRPRHHAQATCDCGHPLAMHDPASNECHGETLTHDVHNPQGFLIGNQLRPCTCRQYIGPRPVESLFATPTLPPRDPD
jgi:hypothetical protein